MYTYSSMPNCNNDLPAAKRVKMLTIKDESSLYDESVENSGNDIATKLKNKYREEIPDSQGEGEDRSDDETRFHDKGQTDLESVLPLIKTDKEAIAEYESMRSMSQEIPTNVKERLNTRSWTAGRSSIYVDAFNLALDTVLEDEGHLFDEAEKEVFSQWKILDYECQYLYVRLFLRKTSAWHRMSHLGYHEDISDISRAINVLQSRRDLPDSTAIQPIYPGEHLSSIPPCLGRSFTFADSSDIEIRALEEASTLLTLDELKTVAKDAKVQGNNKAELMKALQRMSQGQRGLDWSNLRGSHTKNNSRVGDVALRHDNIMLTEDILVQTDAKVEIVNFSNGNRDNLFVSRILASVGPCIRLSAHTLRLFERVHLVFYRSTEWTDKSLTTIILAQISRRIFPRYIVSRSANIFASRSLLLEFEVALRTQFRVDSILEYNGSPTRENFEEILSMFDQIYPRWKALLNIEQRKEDQVYESGEGAYLRRFSPAWVYTRIIHKASYVLGRLKMHKREWEMLTELLNQRLFHAGRRGSWYQRKALLEEHYMADLKPDPSIIAPDQQKRCWIRVSLKTCEQALEDRDCHVIYHYDLQKRVKRLEKSLKLAKREQHDFGHVNLRKAVEVSVTGIRVQREVVLSRKTKRSGDRGRSTKTVWIDEREGGGECSVEAMCLSWYRDQGWRGYHAEGGILRTIFAYLFYDVLFLYIPNVFQTPYQTCPLDLHTDGFYPSRASEINRRLAEIANGDAEGLIREVHNREGDEKTCVVGLNWDFAVEDLVEIARSFESTALATVCKVMAQEYRQRGSGIPDLFLWKPEKKEVMFSEVKSENDRLSDTQRLWVHVLTGAGIRVELCNAVARETRIKQA